jgi:hypothetical protein
VPCDAKEEEDALDALEARISAHAVPDDATEAVDAELATVPEDAVDPPVVLQGTQFPAAEIDPAEATEATDAINPTVPEDPVVDPVDATDAKVPKDAIDALPGYIRICSSYVPEDASELL